MGYLVTHIATFLVFAQLLGLLLGWLLWGYLAKQRAIEVQSLRARLADMQLLAPRMAFAGGERVPLTSAAEPSLPEPSLPKSSACAAMIENDAAPPPASDVPTASKASSVSADLEAEVAAARLLHFEKQVRELEGFRDRWPLLQAELGEAVAARRSAEEQIREESSHFEIRLSSLLSQVRDFERAAQEWDLMRDAYERAEIAKERELATVKAHLRDLQNNQLPQKAEPVATGGVPIREHTDLRERYQKAITERDALAAQLEALRRDGGPGYESTTRVAELEETLRMKDASLVEQVAQTESLLWRVAELEPFSLAVPKLEEDLGRQESEIAGHLAMHSENSDHIRSLLKRVAELEAERGRALELERLLAEASTERDDASRYHAEQVTEWQRTVAQRDEELAGERTLLTQAKDEHAALVSGLEERIAQFEEDTRRAVAMERLLGEQNSELNRLSSALNVAQSELSAFEERAIAWESIVNQREVELQRLDETQSKLQDRLGDLSQQLSASATRLLHMEPLLSEQALEIQRIQAVRQTQDELLAALQQRLAEAEPLAAYATEATQKLSALEERQKAERTRLNVSSAQRRRRLRQSMQSFRS